MVSLLGSVRRQWRLTLVVAAVAILATLLAVGWNFQRRLRAAAERASAERNIPVTVSQLPSPAPSAAEWISAPAVFSDVARFQNRLYLCGPAGLMEYDLGGVLQKHYAAGRELPAAPLVRMRVGTLADSREPELLIATMGAGVLAFNGSRFRQMLPADAEARMVTALLPLATGRLLIGTRKRGVMLLDGRQLTSFHPSLANFYVTELAGDGDDLWVGSLDRGVLHAHAGQTDAFGEAQGLPDPQVHAITVAGDRAYVGTSLGIAEFLGGRFSRVIGAQLFATALQVRQQELLVGTLDQGVFRLPLGAPPANAAREFAGAGIANVRRIFAGDGDVLALGRGGVYELTAGESAWKSVLRPESPVLTDGNISALAVDRQGRLWVGFFDRGLDILEAGARQARHVEDEHVFCVNRVLVDERTGNVSVATANGLAMFSPAGVEKQVLTRADGLIADHVTDVVAYRGGLALATPAGITLLSSDGAQSLYAFHGLVNNHVYALAAAGDDLMAGTLGGLSLLTKGSVQANLTSANTGLKHNWITAVTRVGNEWFVGTYGGGIFGLDNTARVEQFEGATAPIEVNPNAMLATERYVLAGTLGQGLYVFDLAARRWRAVREGLPSENVTALAAANGQIYVGTDNGLIRIPEQALGQ
jgi:ligand-binding sensor domain-containing protein